MKIEYEATFLDIDRKVFTEKLKQIGAKLGRAEYLQRRVILELPEGMRKNSIWIRVRDEGDKITLTLKSVDGTTIAGQKEICVNVSDFNDTVALFESIGCRKKAYQESKRELWNIGSVEVALDTWPFLDTYVEIEGPDEQSVKDLAQELGLKYEQAIFDTVNAVYKRKYGKILEDLDKNILMNFTFDIQNPFL
jgi:adenylate cyclase class 2